MIWKFRNVQKNLQNHIWVWLPAGSRSPVEWSDDSQIAATTFLLLFILRSILIYLGLLLNLAVTLCLCFLLYQLGQCNTYLFAEFLAPPTLIISMITSFPSRLFSSAYLFLISNFIILRDDSMFSFSDCFSNVGPNFWRISLKSLVILSS